MAAWPGLINSISVSGTSFSWLQRIQKGSGVVHPITQIEIAGREDLLDVLRSSYRFFRGSDAVEIIIDLKDVPGGVRCFRMFLPIFIGDTLYDADGDIRVSP